MSPEACVVVARISAPHFRLWRWVFVALTVTVGDRQSRVFRVMRQGRGEDCPACAALQRLRLAHIRGDL